MSCNETIAIPDDWYLGPSLKQVNECQPPEWLPLLIIGAILVVITGVIYFLILRQFTEFSWRQAFQYFLTKRLLNYYVMFAFVHFLKILNPRANEVYSYIGDCWEAFVLYSFYQLMWAYTGGDVVPKLLGVEISLGAPPFCCLRLAPLKKITKGYIKFNEWLLLQLPLVQITIGLLKLSIALNGEAEVVGSPQSHASIIFAVIMVISFMLGMYGLGIIYSMTLQFTMNKGLRSKFIVFKVSIVLAKVQALIFSLSSGSVDSYGWMAGKYRADTWHSFLVIVESLVLLCVASLFYHKSDFDQQTDIAKTVTPSYTKHDDKDVELVMEEIDLGSPALVLSNQAAI